METPKIYLETTMFSFYYEERTEARYQELKAQVCQVFDLIKAGKYEPYTSAYAADELEGEPDIQRREKMERLIREYDVKFLAQSDEAERLATLYIQEGAIPEAYPTNAIHIAITTVNSLDFIVSLNFGHIARPWTIERVRRVNGRENYKGVGIYRPAEVLEL
ncbi:MAG: hypothetical protein LBU16_06940 [Treponema sp.]|jgi:hypothetical protein|nr:hypothetical protein [Treponema sp.]